MVPARVRAEELATNAQLGAAELRRGDAGADAGAGRVGARRRPRRLLPAPVRLARLNAGGRAIEHLQGSVLKVHRQRLLCKRIQFVPRSSHFSSYHGPCNVVTDNHLQLFQKKNNHLQNEPLKFW